jgi:hypothetical protein
MTWGPSCALQVCRCTPTPLSAGARRGSNCPSLRPRGVDRCGERFELETLLDNLSATGLHLRLARPVEPGATLFIIVWLTTRLGQWPLGRALRRAGRYCGPTCGQVARGDSPSRSGATAFCMQTLPNAFKPAALYYLGE